MKTIATFQPEKNITNNNRQSEYPIDKVFLSRWSPRAFDGTAMPYQDLLTILEAARWAPSAYNVQPWRFLYAIHGDNYWDKYLSCLDDFNAGWAQYSGAIIFLISDTLSPGPAPCKPFPSYSFDAGAAWIHMALQAQKLGYQAHAMAGIHHAAIKRELAIPERFSVEIGIAIGKVGNRDKLPPALQKREQPSSRKPLASLLSAGLYRFDQK